MIVPSDSKIVLSKIDISTVVLQVIQLTWVSIIIIINNFKFLSNCSEVVFGASKNTRRIENYYNGCKITAWLWRLSGLHGRQ